ncbi:hypothetical protein QRO11_12795 [Paracidovorax citrulli]|uniref:Uncharacterized protein n=1 Tax=Paracidovorax citrulli TaxID=80869 RepID=A0ABY9AK39_PARCI|nr:hypothetical protein [Paracidovorax citrulli]PVY63055.1 hypothetical protein C8E08_0326 [Paracidovorax citrulli]QCX12645.1 hypothetical protein APS58_3934 [Paracidovorax citrulli]REG67962.1 hypothetical protein C8E07_1053 [Paracidovorax citrulli]RLJ92521.1 hypothetical protein C8E06_1054 [Paracidovorax citrulli]WIY31891.1 hypothetical protein QRO09_09285 [Paracidovorax citrulli]
MQQPQTLRQTGGFPHSDFVHGAGTGERLRAGGTRGQAHRAGA